MHSSSSLLIAIGSLVLVVGLTVGFWLGIVGLAKARRGAAWWLMTVGVVLCTLGAISYGIGMWVIVGSIGSYISTTGASTAGSASIGSSVWGAMMIGLGSIGALAGTLSFSIGFALHGQAAAKLAQRAAELEELAASMSEEIHKLREGGNRL